ncbi:MAG: hypothetical protein JWQ49_1719 [Edaphobacter sp.]|jgi:hypothetical protein|nr:hypothetical protein [Edaphobacter sp.]
MPSPKRYKDRALPPLRTGDLGLPDESLSDKEKVIWLELAESAPIGLLQRSDRMAVELCCRLLSKAREGEAMPDELKVLGQMLRACGFTPLARERIMRRLFPKAAMRKIRR